MARVRGCGGYKSHSHSFVCSPNSQAPSVMLGQSCRPQEDSTQTACLESWTATHLPAQRARDPSAWPLVPTAPLTWDSLPSPCPSSISCALWGPFQVFHGAAEACSVALIPMVPAPPGLLSRVCCHCGTGVSVVPLAARPPTPGTYRGRTEVLAPSPDFLHA